jgi:hypothetical protein
MNYSRHRAKRARGGILRIFVFCGLQLKSYESCIIIPEFLYRNDCDITTSPSTSNHYVILRLTGVGYTVSNLIANQQVLVLYCYQSVQD